ncbi:RNA polymerase sigma factor [Niabella aquatica]
MFKKLLPADEREFAGIIKKYGPWIKRRILKWLPDAALAQELVQDVFVQLWKDREQVALLANPIGWLYTVARYKTIDKVRAEMKFRTHRLQEDETAYGVPAGDPGAEEDTELLLKLSEGLQQIPERQRQALLLFANRNRTIEEIAREMNITVFTVKTHLARARSHLRQYLKNTGY